MIELKHNRYTSQIIQKYLPEWDTTQWVKFVAYEALYNWKSEGVHLVSWQGEYFSEWVYTSIYTLWLVKRWIRWYTPLRIEYYSFDEPVTIVSFESDQYPNDEEALIGNIWSYGYTYRLQEKALWVIELSELRSAIQKVLPVPIDSNEYWIANYTLEIVEETAKKSLLDWKAQRVQRNIIYIDDTWVANNSFSRYSRVHVWTLEVSMRYFNWEILIDTVVVKE